MRYALLFNLYRRILDLSQNWLLLVAAEIGISAEQYRREEHVAQNGILQKWQTRRVAGHQAGRCTRVHWRLNEYAEIGHQKEHYRSGHRCGDHTCWRYFSFENQITHGHYRRKTHVHPHRGKPSECWEKCAIDYVIEYQIAQEQRSKRHQNAPRLAQISGSEQGHSTNGRKVVRMRHQTGSSSRKNQRKGKG